MASHRASAGSRASRFLAALVVVTACRRSTPAAVALDASATDARRSAAPPDVGPVSEARRVAAYTPDITETILALGGRDRLVAVSSREVARGEIEGLARVGSQVAPDMAALAAARPDLVIVAEGPVGSGLAEGRSAGMAVEMVSFEGSARYAQTVALLAAHLGRPAAGAALLARIEAGLAAVRRSAGDAGARPKVVALLHRQPMVVAGPGSFLEGLITVAGGRNAAANTNQFPIVGAEMIVGWAPDVLIDFTDGAGQGIEALIPGLQTRRVVALSPDGMVRPGPRAPEAAQRLLEALRQR